MRRVNYKVAAVAVAVALFAGCATELRTVRVTKPEEVPPAGAPYNLTFTQFDITVTRRLDGCVNKETGAKEMTVAVDAAISRKEVRDPSREYVIDFAALRSFFKTSNVTVEYHPNGALKSVNAGAEDKTGPFLTSVLSSFGKIAALKSVDPSPSMAAEKDVCTQAALNALRDIPKHEGDVAEKTKTMALVTADLERVTAMGAALGRAWGDKERRELAAQIALLYKARRELADANDKLTKSVQSITITTKETWPPNGETHDSKSPLVAALTKESIKSWGVPSDANMKAIASGTAVWPLLRAATPISRMPCAGTKCADDDVAGLKYRMPVPGELLICTKPGKKDNSCEPDSLVARDAGPMSQLGPVFALPMKNYPFMKQSIEATFNEAGQPTKLGYKDEAAAAEGVAGVFGTLVDEVAKVREARKPKTELEKLKEETELLKAKQELAAAKKALEPPKFASQADAVAAFTADTTVLQAELAKLQAEAALAAAQAQAKKP
jgi:hypothetical protein